MAAAIATFDVEDVRRFSDDLRALGGAADAMDDAAQRIASYLYEELRAPDGGRACALVRVYKTHPFGKLTPPLQAFVGEPLEPDVRCLTLLGTAGELPAWNDRRTSIGHQAIPLPSERVVEQLPMVLQLITQLGLDVTTVVRPDPEQARELSQRTYDVFHVADAASSPYVPAKDFVERHGVRSALGFGGMLYTGDFYAVVLFSKTPISDDAAQMLKILSLPVRVPLLAHLRRVFGD
jgi:hypothetical protein